ncbi:olfactory receptor 5V1-like [Pleurodeles waltl]|uniref:olfactory receptor 5V1-like n=1 Tax=Pleurodeles waltl TaxID=8319 RepID=UPI0037095ECF
MVEVKESNAGVCSAKPIYEVLHYSKYCSDEIELKQRKLKVEVMVIQIKAAQTGVQGSFHQQQQQQQQGNMIQTNSDDEDDPAPETECEITIEEYPLIDFFQVFTVKELPPDLQGTVKERVFSHQKSLVFIRFILKVIHSKVAFLSSYLSREAATWAIPLVRKDSHLLYIWRNFVREFERVFDRRTVTLSADQHIEKLNSTRVNGFILVGLSNDPQHQVILFVVFLMLYIINLLANMLMIAAITMYTGLNSPMYYFLRNLSFIDICFTSTTVPRMLIDFLSQVKFISFPGCVVQLYFFICLGGVECTLLAAMALDRYVAVCKPLHYTVIMNKRVCFWLAVTCWSAGFLNSLAHTAFTFHLPFCKSNTINHFFCDIPPLLALSCGDTEINEIMLYTTGAIVILGPFTFTLLSYVFIISAIIKIRTSEGRRKAFSTCVSHLSVVCLFFGPVVVTYIRPMSTYTVEQDMVIPVLYVVLTPMLNPLIYSLRNKEVVGNLKKAIQKVKTRNIG